MVSAIVKKILWSIPLLLLVSMIMFGVIHMLPGNAALVMLGDAEDLLNRYRSWKNQWD